MDAQEFAAAILGKTERRGTQVREVGNGFNIVFTRTFNDKDTDNTVFSVSEEAVAMDVNLLLMLFERFFRTGLITA